MKSIKLALMAGAAVAVSAAAAQADDLDALKAQIETLNARVAAMEAAPAVPAGYSLLSISKGTYETTPGLETYNKDLVTGSRTHVISILPTADAPAGATITWSGQVRSGLVYSSTEDDFSVSFSDPNDAQDVFNFADPANQLSEDGEYDIYNRDDDDLDVPAQARLNVKASTDTAVGEVGVELELRADFNGLGVGDAYFQTAWGYWAMTPELTFGGGYTGSLGQIGYGYDGACTCIWTDYADVGFNPGDTSQLRLSYGSGPFAMAIALEDAGTNNTGIGGPSFVGNQDGNSDTVPTGDRLGVAGEIKYSGDTFSGEISGVWRDVDEDANFDVDTNWQVGAGVGFALGDMANLSFAAAMGEGPTTKVEDGNVVTSLPFNNTWWGVSGLASFGLTDAVHAEVAAGYKHREGNDFDFTDDSGDDWAFDGFEYETYAFLGGIYYTPVDQLTIGLEGEWYTSDSELKGTEEVYDNEQDTVKLERDTTTFIASFAAVWRF